MSGALLVHQKFYAGIKRRLGKLDRPNVILRHCDPRRPVMQQVGKGAAVFENTLAARGEPAIDNAILRDDPRKIHFGDHLDDAGTADSGHADLCCRFSKPRLVRPRFDADHAETRFKRDRVDPHTFDRTRRCALAR
ncbi:hypothetical protein D3C73_1261070 [compost metagenome]